MTQKGRVVFGATILAPIVYLTLVYLYSLYPDIPGYGPRELLSGDFKAAGVIAICTYILSLLIARFDPDLRSQDLLPPEKK